MPRKKWYGRPTVFFGETEGAIRQALELDLSIKTGQINDRTAVEILICSLAAE